jgi:hypothetical protein
VTTDGRARWQAADRSERAVENARRTYREWILGWYWALLAPVQPGSVVPDEVALLLAEDWDERTKPRAPRGLVE